MIAKNVDFNFTTSGDKIDLEFSESDMKGASMIFIDIISKITVSSSNTQNLLITLNDLSKSKFIATFYNSRVTDAVFNDFLIIFNSKNPIAYVIGSGRTQAKQFESQSVDIDFDEIRKISYGISGDNIKTNGNIKITVVK